MHMSPSSDVENLFGWEYNGEDNELVKERRQFV